MLKFLKVLNPYFFLNIMEIVHKTTTITKIVNESCKTSRRYNDAGTQQRKKTRLVKDPKPQTQNRPCRFDLND